MIRSAVGRRSSLRTHPQHLRHQRWTRPHPAKQKDIYTQDRRSGDATGFTYCFIRRHSAETKRALPLHSLARMFAKRVSRQLGIEIPANDWFPLKARSASRSSARSWEWAAQLTRNVKLHRGAQKCHFHAWSTGNNQLWPRRPVYAQGMGWRLCWISWDDGEYGRQRPRKRQHLDRKILENDLIWVHLHYAGGKGRGPVLWNQEIHWRLQLPPTLPRNCRAARKKRPQALINSTVGSKLYIR